ncbi:hypothetical protein [Rhodococcus sp. IEGM 1374]|nr:hypothetical protein [Rhodococcus sp. IEGM 1374]MDV7991119.1 hypothetical protein [Rhodococcus sp. IEGM 1374]
MSNPPVDTAMPLAAGSHPDPASALLSMIGADCTHRALVDPA